MRPVTVVDLPVLRMIPVARAIRRAVGGTGIAVWRHRFAVRGWNGGQASPAGDLNRLLDDIRARYDGVHVFLTGHSMGARAAAFRVEADNARCRHPPLPGDARTYHVTIKALPMPVRASPGADRHEAAKKYKNRQRQHRRRQRTSDNGPDSRRYARLVARSG
jgi:hypothetical protein